MQCLEKREASTRRRQETQAVVATVPCEPGRGLTAIKLIGKTGNTAAEYFVPFSYENSNSSERECSYAGFMAAIDRLRSLKLERILVLTDDHVLVDELERRSDPPKELFLQYVFLGCKLNEFRRAKVVAMRSTALEELRVKAHALAQTIYRNGPSLAQAI